MQVGKICKETVPQRENIGSKPALQEDSVSHKKSRNSGDFPGGPVVKNPPANPGDMGLIPAPGGSHVPWSNWSRVPQLPLSPRARGSASREAPAKRSPLTTTRESPFAATKTQHNQKQINN